MKKGFTLIELLIVISVLGILAGIVLTVINPTRQSEKAKEGVIKANVDKLALALNVCNSASPDPANYGYCNSLGASGAVNPAGNPAGSWYDIYGWGGYLRAYGCYNNTSGQCCYLYQLQLSNFASSRWIDWTAGNCRGQW